MTSHTLDLSTDVSDFFRSRLNEAMESRRCDATGAASSYVVELLAAYARPDALDPSTLEKPLTLQLVEAMQELGHERFERLRTIGDTVLYTSGFFAEHLQQRGVDAEYVASVGARAYGEAAGMMRGKVASDAPDVLRELAANFGMFVELIGDVSDDVLARSAHSPRGMLRVYERWAHRGSARLAAALVNQGLMPVVGGNGTLH